MSLNVYMPMFLSFLLFTLNYMGGKKMSIIYFKFVI